MAPPRHLVLKALAKAVNAAVPAPTDIDDGISTLEPGEMQLYSFFVPGLLSEEYTIQVSQHVELDGVALDLKLRDGNVLAEQKFYVQGPQFSIPAADFHSSYPPQGHADQPSIAPHIVFTDPHLPWERPISENDSDVDNVTPWLAVFPFDVNNPTTPELRLSDPQLADVKLALGLPDTAKPGPAFSISTTIQNFLALPTQMTAKAKNGTVVHIPDYSKDSQYSDLQSETTPIEVIFMTSKLFQDLFCINGVPNADQFRYCAHIRNINTTGITGAGTTDTGLYSVVMSKRSGPYDIAVASPPRSQAVHLLSLEFISSLVNLGSNDLVAFVSLYKWTYLCQPPLSVNFIDAMRDIGIQLKWSQGAPLDANELTDFNAHIQDTPKNAYLMCSPKVLGAVQQQTAALQDGDPRKALGKRMLERLQDGYSMVRYRVQSGEETTGLFRGALLPVRPQAPPAAWPYSSCNGQDYQILDKTLGMMDISYSCAWQLGRLMASSDTSFVSALMRIRTRAYQSGVVSSDFLSANDAIGLTTQKQFFSSLPHTLDLMQQVSAMGGAPSVDLRDRWDRSSRSLDTSVDPHAFVAGVQNHIQTVGSAAGTDNLVPVQDLFAATSTDWMTIHNWILDQMFLASIPTHYLITDPNLLPPESMRFFHIDNNWMDCFIDGALSCANHSSLTDEDVVRDEIKAQFNQYLQTPIFVDPLDPTSKQLHAPQIPIYGFFLRSAVVAAFQDLIVEVPYPASVDRAGKAPILVQKRLGSDILMVLLDRLPDKGMLPSIKFRQPPHQQRFCAADYLSSSEATYLFRKIAYTGSPSLEQFGPDVRFSPSDGAASVFNFESRCINFSQLESLLFDPTFMQGKYSDLPEYFVDDPSWKDAASAGHKLSSALVGIQLNDSMKYLEIIPPDITIPDPPTPQNPYQIRARTPSALVASAKSKLVAVKSLKMSRKPVATLLQTKSFAKVTSPQQRMGFLPPSTLFTALEAIGPRSGKISNQQKPPLSSPSSSSSPHAAAQQLPIRAALVQKAAAVNPRITRSAFIYTVYPREVTLAAAQDPKVKNGGLLYSDAHSLSDLIFSVRLDPTMAHDVSAPLLNLRRIQFSIPLGPSAGRKSTADPSPGVAPMGGSGYRARMLSNQRWVAVIDPGDTFLTVRLIARSMNQCEPLVGTPASDAKGNIKSNCDELGFLLSGMDTGWMSAAKKTDNEPGNAVVVVAESYGKQSVNDQGTVNATIIVKKLTGWKPLPDKVA